MIHRLQLPSALAFCLQNSGVGGADLAKMAFGVSQELRLQFLVVAVVGDLWSLLLYLPQPKLWEVGHRIVRGGHGLFFGWHLTRREGYRYLPTRVPGRV